MSVISIRKKRQTQENLVPGALMVFEKQKRHQVCRDLFNRVALRPTRRD